MKLYLVRGEHFSVPGTPTKATMDEESAHAFAAELVTQLLRDAYNFSGKNPDTVEPATPHNWKERLLDAQALRFSDSDTDDAEAIAEARAYLDGCGSVVAAREAECDVWIEKIDVEGGQELEPGDHIQPLEKAPTPVAAEIPADTLMEKIVPEIAIIMDGGCIHEVLSRGGQRVRVHVVDYDTEDCDEADLTAIPQQGGKFASAYVSQHGPELNNAWAPEWWDAVIAAGSAE